MKRLACILLVDDDSINNFLNQKLFAKLDIADKVEIIEEGEKALRFLNEFHTLNNCHPDLIFIDVNMPKMNGFEFVARFKAAYPESHHTAKIIMLTSALSKKDRKQIEETSITCAIEKPLTFEKLDLIRNM